MTTAEHTADAEQLTTDYESLHALLQAFEGVCNLCNARYFAIGSTLVDAVEYGDFNVAGNTISVALLRADYAKLVDAFTYGALDGFGLMRTFSPSGRLSVSFAHGQGRRAAVAEAEAAAAADELEPTQDEAEPAIAVTVLDALTDDHDLTRCQIALLKAAGKALKMTGSLNEATPALQVLWNVASLYERQPHNNVANIMEAKATPIPLKDVSSTVRVPFGDSSIPIPEKTDCWIESNREAELARTRALQADILAIFKEIDRICKANDIGYFATAGTLLGAVRHHGFIPWDNDGDLGMLRDDYERFLAIAPEQLDSRFFLQTRATEPESPYLYSKVRMNGTELVTPYIEHRDMHKGISVDIFPFEPTPVDDIDFYEHYARAKAIEKRHKTLFAHRVRNLPSREAHNPVESAGHAVMGVYHNRYWAQSPYELQAEFDALCKQYLHDERSNWAVSYNLKPALLPLDMLLPYSFVPFEDMLMPIPRYVEPILEILYGQDYMELPAPHLRHTPTPVRWRASNGMGSERLD